MHSSIENRNRKLNLCSRLAYFSARHPIAVLSVAVLLALFSIYYTAYHLDFQTSRNDLVAKKEKAVQLSSEISDDFGRLTNVIVVVEGENLDRMKSFITELAARLTVEPQYFEKLLYRIDTASLEGRKLLYLSQGELEDLKQKLEDYGELIEELGFTPQMDTILSYINQKISEATVTHLVSNLLGQDDSATDSGPVKAGVAGPDEDEKPIDLGFLRSLLTEMRLALTPGYRFHSPWDTFFKTTSKFSEDGFLVSDDRRFAFMTLNARSEKGTFLKKRVALKRLRYHIHALLKEHYPDLQAGVTGGSTLADDEMAQAMKDSALASVLAFAGCGLLFMIGFRQIHNPLLVLTSLALATCWTFGLLTLAIGHLTVLSVAFTSIVFGLGIDFGIHLIARYTEERSLGRTHGAAMEQAYERTGKAIVAAGITTAAAFFAVMLADFRGIQELGFIAGSGVMLAMLGTFTVLPALLALVSKRMDRVDNSRLQLRTHLSLLKIPYQHPRWVLILFVLISFVAALGLPLMRFDYNLLNLQAEGTESVVWEKKITKEGGRSSWYAVTTADTLEQVRAKEKAFKALPSVRKVDTMADLIPEDQEARMKAILELQPLVDRFDFALQQPEPLDSESVTQLLEKIQFKLRSDTKWDPQKKPDEAEIALAREALLQLLEALKKTDPQTVRELLEPFQTTLFKDFNEKFQLLKINVNPPGPLRLEDVPQEFRERFQGKSGQYLIQIFSRDNIWERAPMKNFVQQLRSVDPDVTGPPIVGFIAIELMKKGYIQGGIYALLVNIVVIGWAFRKWKDTTLALTPLAFTLFWTLGCMGLFGISFNLANLLGLPLIIGSAEDYGVHVVHRFREDPNLTHALISGSTARAINLASWTSMIGFGSLLIAKHYGVFSLGLVVTLALGIAWLLSLILLPVVLINFVKEREEPVGEEPAKHGLA